MRGRVKNVGNAAMTDHAQRAREHRERLRAAIENMEKTEVCLDIFDRAIDQAAQPVLSPDKPTVGWYWWRNRTVHVDCLIVQLAWSLCDPSLLVVRDGASFLIGLPVDSIGGEFAGPIPLPREATCQE